MFLYLVLFFFSLPVFAPPPFCPPLPVKTFFIIL
jgi:hypothetical protein